MNHNRRLGTMGLSTRILLGSGFLLLFSGCSASAGTNPVPSTTAPPETQQQQEESSSAAAEHEKASGEAPAGAASEEKTEAEGKDGEAAEAGSGLTEVETTEEKRENLDRKLDSSLREFDGLILREQEILEERREASAQGGGGGGGGGAAGGGAGEERGETEAGGGEEERTADGGGTGGSPDAPSGEPVSTEQGDSGDRNAELSNGRVPPDVGDGSDDDIVARQLREAAMEEEDPELREKLWDEYRAYKAGIAGKAKPKSEESGL